MGRYYNGDIEGKFWFAVQSSNDADYFGVQGEQSPYLDYSFEKEDAAKVLKGISECKKILGKKKQKLDDFFKECDSYNDEMLMPILKDTEEGIRETLKWYARLGLGEEIYACIKENGECRFEAEL